MRYLLSSILCILFVSCASYPKKNNFSKVSSGQDSITNVYFSNPSKDYVYKANIDAFGNAFGGIFIVKKIETNHHRIVFTTEMGNKIFDFSFEGENFKVNHILKELDKKILINILKDDFWVLIKEMPAVTKQFQKNTTAIYQTRIGKKNYYHFVQGKTLNQVIRTKHGKKKVTFLFSEINNNIANQIQILHQNIDLSIALKAL